MESSTSIVLPAWYESSAGPGISRTISSIALNMIPLANIIAMAYGHSLSIVPEVLNFWITILVFIGISIRTGIGYIRAKKIFGAQLARLKRENEELGRQLGSRTGGSVSPR